MKTPHSYHKGYTEEERRLANMANKRNSRARLGQVKVKERKLTRSQMMGKANLPRAYTIARLKGIELEWEMRRIRRELKFTRME